MSTERLAYEDRKILVVDAAARLFATAGYDATSIEDILHATGLKKGSLYYYISGKLDLLVEIHNRCMLPLLSETELVVQTISAPDERLRAFAGIFMANLFEFNDHVRVVLHEWRRMSQHAEWPTLRSQRRQIEIAIASALREGEAEGLFRGMNPRLATLTFIGMLNYSYVWLELAKKDTDPSAIAGVMADIFLHGVAKRDAHGNVGTTAAMTKPKRTP